MDTFDAIRKRRSVRAYTGEPIPREDLEAIVDAGRLAPTGHNTQPWEFIVITDRAMIAHFKVAADWIDQSGAVIALVLAPTSRWWLEDGAAAVTSMLLAATALGYGSCWLEGRTLQHEETFKTLLNVPADKRLLTLVSVGVPESWPTKEKKSLSDVLHWESYGEKP